MKNKLSAELRYQVIGMYLDSLAAYFLFLNSSSNEEKLTTYAKDNDCAVNMS